MTTITNVEDLRTDTDKTTSYTKSIGYGQAAGIIGTDNLAKGVSAATPGLATHTVNGMGQTVADHPVRVLGGAATVIGGALTANPWAMAAGTAVIWCTAGGPGC